MRSLRTSLLVLCLVPGVLAAPTPPPTPPSEIERVEGLLTRARAGDLIAMDSLIRREAELGFGFQLLQEFWFLLRDRAADGDRLAANFMAELRRRYPDEEAMFDDLDRDIPEEEAPPGGWPVKDDWEPSPEEQRRIEEQERRFRREVLGGLPALLARHDADALGALAARYQRAGDVLDERLPMLEFSARFRREMPPEVDLGMERESILQGTLYWQRQLARIFRSLEARRRAGASPEEITGDLAIMDTGALETVSATLARGEAAMRRALVEDLTSFFAQDEVLALADLLYPREPLAPNPAPRPVVPGEALAAGAALLALALGARRALRSRRAARVAREVKEAVRDLSPETTEATIVSLQELLQGAADEERNRIHWGLARAFLARSDPKLAHAHLGDVEPGALELEEVYALARDLEDHGANEEAQALYVGIQARSLGFRDVGERLEAVRAATPEIPRSLREALGARFSIRERLGSGGMGKVYAAEDKVLGRTVALKVPDEALVTEERHRARFVREVKALAQVSHPNVIRIYEVSTEPPLYFTMELVEGSDLAGILREEGRLETGRALGLLTPLAGALASLHAAGIVHRDIKPANILVGTDGVAYLSDFGVAYLEDATELTRTGQVLGTVAYAAPEQLQGLTNQPSMDVYSFGAVLFLALAGRPPVEGNDILAKLSRGAPSLGEVVPDLDPLLTDLVDRCLALDPAMRPPDGDALRAELEELSRRLGSPAAATRRFLAELDAVIGGELHSLKNRVALAGDDAGREALREEAAAVRGLLEALPAPPPLAARARELAELMDPADPASADAVHDRAAALLGEFELPVRALAEEAARGHPRAADLEVTEEFMPPPVHVADPEGARHDLGLILGNLADNGLEAGASRVTFEVDSAEPARDAALIRIRDDGPGFPDELRPRVFREPLGKDASGGTGLFTIGRLARDRGWELRLEAGTPTTFTLVLPCARDPA